MQKKDDSRRLFVHDYQLGGFKLRRSINERLQRAQPSTRDRGQSEGPQLDQDAYGLALRRVSERGSHQGKAVSHDLALKQAYKSTNPTRAPPDSVLGDYYSGGRPLAYQSGTKNLQNQNSYAEPRSSLLKDHVDIVDVAGRSESDGPVQGRAQGSRPRALHSSQEFLTLEAASNKVN